MADPRPCKPPYQFSVGNVRATKRTDYPRAFCLLFFTLLIQVSALAQSSSLGWQQSQKTDELRGISYPQFALLGKWLTPPKKGAEPAPALIVHCQPGRHAFGRENGKFIDGYFLANTVLAGSPVSTGSEIQFRLDDKKVQAELWQPSTDFGGAFFSNLDLNNLLYGHVFPHKEGTGDPVRKLVIAANEYLALQVVAQFDMPDPTPVAEACGVIFHKR